MDPTKHDPLTTEELWKLLLVQSAFLAGLGWLLSWWGGVGLQWRWPDLREVLLSIALVGPLLLTSTLLLRYSSAYSKAVELLERILGPPMRTRDIPALALLSATVEEYFFRGVLQPMVGLPIAAVLFGLAHVWNRRLLIHGVWAAGAGVYLGLEYEMSGNLLLPILTHALNNLIGLSLLKMGASRSL